MESIILLAATYAATFTDAAITAEDIVRFFVANPLAAINWESGALYVQGIGTEAREPELAQVSGPVTSHEPPPIAVGELIAEGYAFRMEDERSARGFDREGELVGVRRLDTNRAVCSCEEYGCNCSGDDGCRCSERCICNDAAFLGWGTAPEASVRYTRRTDDGRRVAVVDTTAESVGGEIDNLELTDDSDRMGHEADGYVAEQALHRALERVTVAGTDFGEMKSAHFFRVRRTRKLARYAERLGWLIAANRRRGSEVGAAKCRAKLREMRSGVAKRYAESVRLVVESGEKAGLDSSEWDWWRLYVTKAQRDALLKRIDAAMRGTARVTETARHEAVEDDGARPPQRLVFGGRMVADASWATDW